MAFRFAAIDHGGVGRLLAAALAAAPCLLACGTGAPVWIGSHEEDAGGGHDASIGPGPGADAATADSGHSGLPDGGPRDAGHPNDAGVPTRVVHVTAGWRHSCALFAGGSAACWGAGESGRLGDGLGRDSARPVTVRSLEDAIQISAGQQHTCALRTSGRVACWGDNSLGQIGDGTREARWLPTQVGGLEDVVRISAGGTHTCAIRRDGRVICWGHDGFDQLGGGEVLTGKADIRYALGVIDAVDVAAGHQHACALRRDGDVLCWGRVADATVLAVPTRVDRGLRQIAGGRFQWCGVSTTGEVRCRPEIGDAVSVNVGDGFGCAARRSGEVWCWGDGRLGQLGDGTTPGSAETPVRVQGIRDAIHVSGSYEHTCATRSEGTPMCWGRNDRHQVSPSASTAERVPVAVEFGLDTFQ